LQADEMFASLIREMNNAERQSVVTTYPEKEIVPSWL
jgi:hypothetical protein